MSKKHKHLLTKEEHKCVRLLGKAASIYFKSLDSKEYKDQPAFKKLKKKYKLDGHEFCAATHVLQSRVLARAAAREYPKKYRII